MLSDYPSDELTLDDEDLEALTIFDPDEDLTGDGPVSFEAWADIQANARRVGRTEIQVREIEQAMIRVVSAESERQGWGR
jgi:hypothetical protein